MNEKQNRPSPDKRILAAQEIKSVPSAPARLEDQPLEQQVVLTPAEVIDFSQGADS